MTNNICQDCSLHLNRTQIVMPTPCEKGGLLAIGEAPGAEEDVVGEGFVGRAGKTLDKLLLATGVLRAGYGRANICRCRPVGAKGKNRAPDPREIDACIPKLAASIGEMEPSVILCVGWTPGRLFFRQSRLFDAIKEEGGQKRFVPNDFFLTSTLKQIKRPVYVIAMPHTSPLAFNRNAPDGRKWSEIAEEQVRKAVSLVNT